MLISPAYAQTVGGGSDFLGMILPLVLIFAVFYFLLIRPQQRKVKEHKAKVSALRRGDRIVTGGGVIGTVAKVLDNNELIVEIADGVRVRVVASTVSDVLVRSEGGRGAKAEAPDEAEEGVKGRIRRIARKAK